MKSITKLKKKIEMADKLAKLALIDKPQLRCVKGYYHIKDIEPGKLISTQSGQQAVVLNHTNVSTSVLVTKIKNEEEKQFYLGKHRWACTTEVKII